MAQDDMDKENSKEQEKQKDEQNNIKNIKNAADVAIASGHPVAAGIGAGVKVVDKATGGKASEVIGKGLTRANKVVPGGNQFQRLSNKLSESGVSDAAGTVSSIKNSASGEISKKETVSKTTDISEKEIPKNNSNTDTNQTFSSKDNEKKKSFVAPENSNNNIDTNNEEEKKNSETTVDLEGFAKKRIIKICLTIFFPVLLLLLLILLTFGYIGNIFGNFSDAFGISLIFGDKPEELEYTIEDEDLKEYYERVYKIYNEDVQNNIMVCKPIYTVAVFHIFSLDGTDKVSYKTLNDSQIQDVFLASVDNEFNLYNKEIFQENLKEKIIPQYFPEKDDEEKEHMVEEIFKYVSDYYSLIGLEEEEEELCETGVHTCSYKITKGFYNSEKGIAKANIDLSNIYVQLMKCNNPKTKLENEELIPFEKYILGVTYGATEESDPEEALKAYSIMVRDYALGIYKYNQKWTLKKSKDNRIILQISSCYSDNTPIYCDPDQGCSSNGEQVYSGNMFALEKKALPDNAKLRKSVESVYGKTIENQDGYVIFTEYNHKNRNSFITLANKGLSYEEILLSYYKNKGAYDINTNNCESIRQSTSCISTGEFSKWKQTDPAWKDTPIGNSGKTLGQIGCLVTSIAMQIAKSGVKTNITNFNPKTFVLFLNEHGGFDARGNFQWSAATKAAPSFKFGGRLYILDKSRSEKLEAIKNLVSQKGVYVLAEVKGNTGEHWVAIDSVVGDTINIMDSGSHSGNTNMWSAYEWQNTSILTYYRVG